MPAFNTVLSIEWAYRPSASYYRIDQGLSRDAGEAQDVLLQNAQALLDTTAVDLERLAGADDPGLDLSDEILRTHVRLRLSPDDVGELRGRLRELLDAFGNRGSAQTSSEIRLTLVSYPWPDDRKPDD